MPYFSYVYIGTPRYPTPKTQNRTFVHPAPPIPGRNRVGTLEYLFEGWSLRTAIPTPVCPISDTSTTPKGHIASITNKAYMNTDTSPDTGDPGSCRPVSAPECEPWARAQRLGLVMSAALADAPQDVRLPAGDARLHLPRLLPPGVRYCHAWLPLTFFAARSRRSCCSSS